MDLDQPWKIAALIGLLAVLRVVWGLWRRAPRRSSMVELLDSGLIAFALVFLLVRPFVAQSFYIPSASMEPTLRGPQREYEGPEAGGKAWGAPAGLGISYRSLGGDHILVNRFIYRLSSPRRGDIIVFRAPPQALRGQRQSDFIKRLIGLPGDVIRIRRGDGVYVNGERLQEPATIPAPDYDWPEDRAGSPSRKPYRVPPNCYFVLGDNRNRSYDSHAWQLGDGTPRPELERSRLVGKAMVVFWPPGRIGLVGDSADLRLGPSSRAAAVGLALPCQPGERGPALSLSKGTLALHWHQT